MGMLKQQACSPIATQFLSLGKLKGNIMAKQENKLFTVAGTATNPDGTTKVRFANDLVARVKILSKNGCSNIELMELPEPMTKLAALEYLQELRRSGDEGYVIANKLQEKARVAKRRDVSVTLRAGTKAKVTPQVPAIGGMTPLGLAEVMTTPALM